MKSFESFELVYTEEYTTRRDVMQREWELKQWTKAKKEALVTQEKVIVK
jgi:predicted GIY-YIG superfamily endonuclease